MKQSGNVRCINEPRQELVVGSVVPAQGQGHTNQVPLQFMITSQKQVQKDTARRCLAIVQRHKICYEGGSEPDCISAIEKMIRDEFHV